LFRIDAKHRNLKRNENETKRKRNEKEAKLPSFSLRSKMKPNYFRFDAKNVYENEIKRKKTKKKRKLQSEKG
jgi:hypothetical protein